MTRDRIPRFLFIESQKVDEIFHSFSILGEYALKIVFVRGQGKIIVLCFNQSKKQEYGNQRRYACTVIILLKLKVLSSIGYSAYGCKIHFFHNFEPFLVNGT